MHISTKLGLGLGLGISAGNLLHTPVNVIKENPLETLVACAIVAGAVTGVSRLSGYIADNSIKHFTKPIKDYINKKYKNGNRN